MPGTNERRWMSREGAAVLRPDVGPSRRGVLEWTRVLAAPKAVRTSGLCAALLLGLLVANTARADGPAIGWGNDLGGQASPPISVNGTSGTASAISAHVTHRCAIQAETGHVVCWGDDNEGQASPPASVNGTSGTASAIDVGSRHSCAIQAGTDNVVCWGSNSTWYDGSYTGQATPPASVDGTSGTASAIAAGETHSCAIQAGTGNVVCWGSNVSWTYGPAYTGQATPPASVDGTSGTASAISAVANHSCAIQAGTGNVICWGLNGDGEASPPPSVDGTSGTASAIAVGHRHSCAIQAGTGNVVCWGSNFSVLLQATVNQASPPASVDGTSGTASAISAGVDQSCAIQAGTGGGRLRGVFAVRACLGRRYRRHGERHRRRSVGKLRDPGRDQQRHLLGLLLSDVGCSLFGQRHPRHGERHRGRGRP